MNFHDRFFKNTRISRFLKIRLVGAEMFHAGGQTKRRTYGWTNRQTYMTKQMVAFRIFCQPA